MKKAAAFLLALTTGASVVALAACGDEEKSTDTTVTSEEWASALEFANEEYSYTYLVYNQTGYEAALVEIDGNVGKLKESEEELELSGADGEVEKPDLSKVAWELVYYEQVGETYYKYESEDGTTFKKEEDESQFFNTCKRICSQYVSAELFVYDAFTYDKSSKKYVLDSVDGGGEITYTDVKIGFEDGKVVFVSYYVSVGMNFELTISYDEVNIVLPEVSE
ncbi:MAG: hypothetical protein IJ506_02090 [Clostridia bacterium]|nr:hypothetical protein [Clostridia bacterium]